MQDPIRDLPRVINSAMSIVIIGFVLMNIALYIDLPIAVIRGRSTVVVVSRPLQNPRMIRQISITSHISIKLKRIE